VANRNPRNLLVNLADRLAACCYPPKKPSLDPGLLALPAA
jgi:hypothetical protein